MLAMYKLLTPPRLLLPKKYSFLTFTLTCFLSVDYHLESCVAITLYGHYLFLSSSLICILSIYVA